MNSSGRALVRLLLVTTLALAPALAFAQGPGKTASRRKAPTHVQVKGTRVSLALPEGFTEAQSFNGFRQEETGASLMVTELPLPFAKVSQGLTAEALTSQGMEPLSRKPAKVGGHKGFLVQARQSSGEQVFLKWVLVLGDDSDTLVLTAAWREQDSKALSRPLERAVRSTRWDRDAEPGPGLVLFTLKQTPGLKEAQRVQNTVLYTRDGKPPGTPPTEGPSLIVAPSLANTHVGEDVEAFSRVRLDAAGRGLTLESSALLTVDGLKGHEVVAHGKDSTTQRDFTLYHVLLLDEGRYFLLQGRVGGEDRAVYLEHFKTAVRSFQRVSSP